MRLPIRVILDANLWYRYAYSPLGPTGKRVLRLLEDNDYIILTTQKLEDELIRVFSRQRYKRLFTTEFLQDVWMMYRQGFVTSSETIIKACRDPKDDYLLALAQDGEADYLLTLDEDLLVLKRWGQTTICTLEEFCQARSEP
jgi:uncharacterized protein